MCQLVKRLVLGPQAQSKELRASHLSWYMNWRPKEGVDYAEILKMAEGRYKELLGVFDVLDKKAEWCFGLSAAFAALLFKTATDNNSLQIADILFAFVLLLGSMGVAIRARLPVHRETPYSIRNAIDVLENTATLEGRTAASYHCAIEGLRIVNAWKGSQLALSALLFVGGIALSVFAYLFS